LLGAGVPSAEQILNLYRSLTGREQYLKHAYKVKRTAAEDERMLNRDVLPKWGDRSVRSITRRDVRDILERVVDRGSPIAANRLLEVVRRMFNWGIQHDWLAGNPAAQIEKPGVEQSRDRVLTNDEIRALWSLLGRFPACRSGEGRREGSPGSHNRSSVEAGKEDGREAQGHITDLLFLPTANPDYRLTEAIRRLSTARSELRKT
jgi:integrase